jgi:hypothetical protein
MAAKGEALPDGSYPIKNRADLENAIHAVGRGNAPHAKIMAHIKKRARKLNAEAMLPAAWSIMELHDLADDYGLDLLDNEERLKAYAVWNAIAERMTREDGLETIGTWGANLHGIGLAKPGAARLAAYWTHGEGAAKIGWGTKGAMTRCIAELGKYVHKSPGGLCADYHKIATGEWPTEHGKAGIPS